MRSHVQTRRPATSAAVQVPRVVPSAKMFGWKDRENPDYAKIDGDGTFTLTNLRPAPGSKHRKKRKGRGHAAGQGGSCGFGMRGQKSRSGRPTRPGFEGGQTPLYRRIPKFVGRPMGKGHKRTEYALVKIEHLNTCSAGAVVTLQSLQETGVVTKQKRKLYKVVGGEELTVPNLTVKAHAFTSSAVGAIEKAGGKCVLVSPTTGKDLILDDEDDAKAVAVADEEDSEGTESVALDEDVEDDEIASDAELALEEEPVEDDSAEDSEPEAPVAENVEMEEESIAEEPLSETSSSLDEEGVGEPAEIEDASDVEETDIVAEATVEETDDTSESEGGVAEDRNETPSADA